MSMIKTAILLTAVLCCTLCFAEKDVTILAIYQLNPAEPITLPYGLNIDVTGLADDATLLDVMMKARNEGEMTFEGTESTDFGFFVTTIGVLEAGEKQYWKIQGSVGGAAFTPIPKGVSTYVPVDTEKVLFTLVSWSDDSTEGDSTHADTNDGYTSGGSVANLGFRLFIITLLASLILMQH